MSDLKRRILDASAALVAEQGVRAVSFREVARRAGVSHQAPYHHFGDHLGILGALTAEGFTSLADAMDQAADAAGPDPLAALVAAGIAYVRFANDHVGHFRVMFDRSLAGVQSAGAQGQRTRDVLHALAVRAADAGHGSPLDADTLAMLCWSTVHGLATLTVEGILPGDVDVTVVRGLGAALAGSGTKSRQPVGR